MGASRTPHRSNIEKGNDHRTGRKRDNKRKHTTYMRQSTRGRKIEKYAHMNTNPKGFKNKTKPKRKKKKKTNTGPEEKGITKRKYTTYMKQ